MWATGLVGGGRDDASALSKAAKRTRSAFVIAPRVPLQAPIKAQEVLSVSLTKVIDCWGFCKNYGRVGLAPGS